MCRRHVALAYMHLHHPGKVVAKTSVLLPLWCVPRVRPRLCGAVVRTGCQHALELVILRSKIKLSLLYVVDLACIRMSARQPIVPSNRRRATSQRGQMEAYYMNLSPRTNPRDMYGCASIHHLGHVESLSWRCQGWP